MDTSVKSARLIALYSPAPQQGKSEVAKHLHKEHGFVIAKFAGPLKFMLGQLLLQAGIPKDELWDYLDGPMKEQQIIGLPMGTTMRHLMRTLGNDWGRKLLGPDVWIDIAMKSIRSHLRKGHSVVVDDMRMLNEYDAILKESGEVWRVVKTTKKFRNDGHSEGLLEGKFFDLSLLNDKTVAVLKQGISATMQLPTPFGQLK